MRLLALDLTSDTNSIAVTHNGVVIAADSWETAQLRRQQAFTRTVKLLDQCSLSINQLDGIAVDIGPGSYFGLRVAYTYALGLAFPHDIPVTGATSCEILAWEWFATGNTGPFIALHDIRRDNLALAIFPSAEHLLRETSPQIRVIARSELCAAIPTGTTVGTPDWSRLGSLLNVSHPSGANVLNRTLHPSATALSTLVTERSRQGHPLHRVSPLYLHPPVAETKRRVESA